MATMNDDVRQRAVEIAEQLGETDKDTRWQIRLALRACGEEMIRAVLQEALDLEARGGMMTHDGARRRTTGGVFFQLLRQRVDRQTWYQKIWVRSSNYQPREGTNPPMAWKERAALVSEALSQSGVATTARIAVRGHVSEVIRKDGFVLVTVARGERLPPLPKELPTPPSVTTVYKVGIADKQWNKIAAAFRKKDEILIAEGYAMPNATKGWIVVYAINVTTRSAQMARRAEVKKDKPR